MSEIRILIISDFNPCPPVNGLYVPIFEFIKSLRKSGDVALDLLLPNTSFVGRSNFTDESLCFNNIFFTAVKKRGFLRVLFDTIFIRSPPYSILLDIGSIDLSYDIAIALPDGFFKTLIAIKENNPTCKTLLWINEPYYTVALGAFLNTNWQSLFGLAQSLISFLKLVLVYAHERRYLKQVDGVIVQTKREKTRYESLVGASTSSKCFICTNPIKKELLDIERNDQRYLLIHAPRGIEEVRDFVIQFCNMVVNDGLNCRLRICTGDLEPYQNLFGHLPNVEVVGYQDNLAHVYSGVFAALVFTRQRYGLVNRVKEAMSAGVVVIAHKESLATVGNVSMGVHAIAARTTNDFVNAALLVTRDAELAFQIGVEARKFLFCHENSGPDKFVQKLLRMVKAVEKE